MNIPRITNAEVTKELTLLIEFADGKKKHVDISPFIKNGVSAALKDQDFFAQVKVKDGFIYWDNGFDFCPKFLYDYTP